MIPRVDLTDKRFGRWVVISFAGYRGTNARWKCRCDCGSVRIRDGTSISRGSSNSCGCYAVERTRAICTTHGQSKKGNRSKEFRTWINMRARCRTKDRNSNEFKYYVAKNIKVCARWRKFENFLVDMGKAPSNKHSIDRIDGSKGYYKANCRWATDIEQTRNASSNIVITWKGKTQCLSAWAAELEISYIALRHRIRRFGWSIERALTEPVRRR